MSERHEGKAEGMGLAFTVSGAAHLSAMWRGESVPWWAEAFCVAVGVLWVLLGPWMARRW